MKSVLISFILIITPIFFVRSQQNEKTVSITVSGSGKTQEEAKQSALRSAIEQTFGAFISSKTEILNDQVVADQMSSVSSGNIQSFTVLNESQLPNGSWANTIKAIVSLDKLTSFVKSKGFNIEIKGAMFAINIKQQQLNEQGEIKAVNEMVGLLHELMQISFDYTIKSEDPKSLDAESKNWEIPLLVTATCNKNIDFCANYFKKTLAALSLAPSIVETYKSLNKQVFPVSVTYQNQTLTYNLRKQSSIAAIRSLMSNWGFYTRLFTVQSGMDESFGNGEGSLFSFSSSNRDYSNENNSSVTINFPTNGQQAATFSWNDKRTLAQIEQMTGYSVKPIGVVSNFKNGGYVVFEKDGHGLVMGLFDVGNYQWLEAKTACDELVLNGYTDWRLPSKEELRFIYTNVYHLGIEEGDSYTSGALYWSSSETNIHYVWCIGFRDGEAYGDYFNKAEKGRVRAVRAF